MSRRVEHLAVIQAEMLESARLVEVGNKLRRREETCRSFLEAGQMLLGGQQRLEKIVQRREQLVADLNAQQPRSIAAGRIMAALDGRIIAALNVKIDKQSAALGILAELLAERRRVAEEALQPLASYKMSGDAAPSDRGMTNSPSSMQGSANSFVAGSEAKRADEPSGAPMSEGGMHTLNATTTDTDVAVDSFGLRPSP